METQYLKVGLRKVLDQLERFYVPSKTNDPVVRCHLSHTDLDGYGCQVITKTIARVSEIKSSLRFYNCDNPANVYETFSKLVNDVRKIVRPDDPVSILITDIDNIDMDKLIDIVRGVIDHSGLWEITIIDHHKSDLIEENPTVQMMDTNDLDEFMIEDAQRYAMIDGTLRSHDIYACGPDPRHHMGTSNQPIKIMYLINRVYCATKILYDLCISQRVRVENLSLAKRHMEQFVNMVNKYDTGIFGQWRIETMCDSVSKQVLLNQILHCAIALDENAKRPFATDLVVEKFVDYCCAASWDDSAWHVLTNTAKQALIDSTADYNRFVELVQTFPIADAFRISHADKDGNVYYHTFRVGDCIGNSYDNGANGRLIGFIYDTEEFNEYNFSLFAEEYLADNQNVWLLMRINDMDKKTVELKSRRSDQVNCRIMATANGGGGHPCAAEFPLADFMKVEMK